MEVRLIDGNALLDKCENLYMRGHILFHGVTAYRIENAPTIDPETLPIVQELREKLMLTEANQQHFKEERDEFQFQVKEIAKIADSEIESRNKRIVELWKELKQAEIELEAMRTAANSLKMHLKEPKVCPLCQGRGRMPTGFYGQGNCSIQDTANNKFPEVCHVCLGKGIIYPDSQKED